jgi:hypothetical protein
MKFFVTGRSTNSDEVEKVFQAILALGHNVTFHWTALPMVKPYQENSGEAEKFAEQAVRAVTESDVYILLSHSDGNGVFAELGAALATWEKDHKIQIFAVNEGNKALAMFHYHPAITWVNSVEEVLKRF